MTTISTIAPAAHTFDPAAWLEDFGQLGGGYYTNSEGKAFVCWASPDHTPGDNITAKAMACQLTAEQHKAIEAHIRAEQERRGLSPILAAWDRIKTARAAYNLASPDDDEAERAHWAIVDPAEDMICSAEAMTAREVEVKLWTALAHCMDHKQDDADAHDENLAALIEREATFDFAARILIGAIRDLRKLEA